MAMLPIALVVLLAAPAAFSAEPPTITTPSITVPSVTIDEAHAGDVVVTAEPVTHTAAVELPAPVSRPALPMVRDFFMPPVQASAWQMPPAPASQPPAPYRVREGDAVRLDWHNFAAADADMNRTYHVRADGTIGLKHVGALRVVGMSHLEVQAAVLSAFAPKIYREGTLSVVAEVTPADELRVTVQGFVNRPGKHHVHATVSRAIEAAGGFAAPAGEEIQIRRSNGQGGFETISVTRTQLLGGDDPALLPDDVITVLQAQVFFVNGEVNSPGQKVWSPGMTVAKAISLAHGMTSSGELEFGHILRPVEDVAGNVLRYTRMNLSLEMLVLADDQLVVQRRTRDMSPGDTVTISVRETPALSGVWELQADGSLRRQGAPSTGTPGAPAPQAAPQAPATELVFTVTGEVNEPGRKVWVEGMTVEKAIALAKGMNPRGKLGHIMRPVRDAQGNVLKYEKISPLTPETEIRPDDQLVIVRRWWGN